MDSEGDVERLFSWLQTPDLHYREFAGERDVLDAKAAWPALREAAAASAAERPAPDADQAAAIPAAPPAAPEMPPARGALGTRLRAVIGRLSPLPPDRSRFTELGPLPPEPASSPGPPELVIEARRPVGEPHAAAPERHDISDHVEPPPRPWPPAPRQSPAPEERTGLFSAAYRGFEETEDELAAVPQPPEPSEHPRSLDAVFSRLAHPPRSHREVRGRVASQSGLGPVFRRLR